MATITSLSLTTPRILGKATENCPKLHTSNCKPWVKSSSTQAQFQLASRRRTWYVGPVASAAPDKISDKVAESIKNAEEACQGDAASGECVAAWDEVEELSAAASHARDRKKDSDPLENYCKDNPETDECRTYDN